MIILECLNDKMQLCQIIYISQLNISPQTSVSPQNHGSHFAQKTKTTKVPKYIGYAECLNDNMMKGNLKND